MLPVDTLPCSDMKNFDCIGINDWKTLEKLKTARVVLTRALLDKVHEKELEASHDSVTVF